MQLQRASNAAPVALGEELGSGGEGTVYPVVGAPEFVAKIYFEPPEANKAAKLSAMTRLAPPELLRIAAWPTDLLLDENGAVRGFLMQRVSSREDAHELYSPKSRRRAFPNADFRFIVHAAANVARAFAQLHSLGHVIGDVNHGNALIGRDATVVLIDCDSFQVKDGEACFTCDVGVPLFTPPELQGQIFRGLTRNADHDAFGLAVLLFHFLYVGRHPFAGRYADGEMPIEQAIAESRFAYGASAASLGMSAPPGTLALDAFGEPMAALFERAFAPPGTTSRPTAVEWVEALQALENVLVACSASPDHDHPKAADCCWCELEGRASLVIFGRAPRRVASYIDAAELDRLWSEIKAVTAPSHVVSLSAHIAAHVANRAKIERFTPYVGVLILFVVGAATSILNLGLGSFVAIMLACLALYLYKVYRKGSASESQLRRLFEMEQRMSHASFFAELARLEDKRRRLLEIQQNPGALMAQELRTREAQQREQYLDGFFLASSDGPSLKAGERAVLLSYGVESAADVLRERSQLHHSLSYAKVRELIQWAESCGNDFVFDPNVGYDVQLQRSVDQELRAEAEKLTGDLHIGAAALERLREEINMRSKAVEKELSAMDTSE